MRNALVDLWDAIEQLENKAEAVEENITDIEESVNELQEGGVGDEGTEKKIENLIHIGENLVEKKQGFEQMADAGRERLEEYEEEPVRDDPDVGEISGWEDTTFHLKELSLGESGEIQDITGTNIQDSNDAFEAGEGAAQVEATRKMVVKSPKGAPDDPAQLPATVGQLVTLMAADMSGQNPLEEGEGNQSFRQRVKN